MKIPPYEAIAWLASIVVRLLLVTYVLRRRAAGRFPAVFSLLAVEAVSSLLLYFLHSSYAWYFYFFWTVYPMKVLLKFAVLFDVIRTIPNVRLTSKERIASLITITISVVGLVAYAATRSSQGWTPPLAGVLANIDHAVAFLWLGLPLIAYLVLGAFEAGWSGRGLRVGVGVLMFALISFIESYSLVLHPNNAILIDAIQALPASATWIFIAWSIAGPAPKPFVLTEEIEAEYKRLRRDYIL